MDRSHRWSIVLLSLPFGVTSTWSLAAGQAPVAAAQPQPAIRLVVLVVVDQMRGDVFHRFGRLFGPDGLRRLSEGGVWFRDAHFSHAHTVTGPGHATIGTGARPATHGIASNAWYDRKSGQSVNCVGDASSPVVGTAGESGNASPANLGASTFADEWILASGGRARAFGVSGKDRGAILPVGRTGKAFWYSTASGRLVSSAYYYKQLPAWAVEFNKTAPSDRFFKKTWERATTDDDGIVTGADDRSFEKDIHGMGRAFPHPLGKGLERPEGKFYEQLVHTPFGDEVVMDFALRLLEVEDLGRRGVTDILSISLSSNDIVGHNFGPDSVEAKELAWHLDRQVTRLLARLDASFGPGGYLVVLTADHGVGFSPEVATERGFEAKRLDSADMLKKINRRLNYSIRYLDWSLGFSGPGYFFDPEALVYAGRPAAELEATVAKVIAGYAGIEAVFTRSDVLAGKLPDSDLARKVRASFHPTRSPDVYVVHKPFWLDGTTTASHGSPHVYDSHVPLVFFGAGLCGREVLRPVDMVDVAATLSAVLRTTPPSASAGAPLLEVTGAIHGSVELSLPKKRL
jgi:predicted AlkP superfamily pyrophosphatase or phosphodiesterase